MNSPNIFDAAVIGAGLAGAASAFALAQRGLRVIVLDAAPHVAAKGSGNLFGLLTPYLSLTKSPPETLYGAGYSFTHSLLKNHAACAESFRATGSLQLPSTQRLANIVNSAAAILGAPTVSRMSTHDASSIAEVPIPSPALFIPDAGFLSPRSFVEGMLAECSGLVTLTLSTECREMSSEGASWQISCSNGETYSCPSVVVCAAHEASKLVPTSWLPLEAIRGQTLCVEATDTSSKLLSVLSYGGYLTPSVQGRHFLGAHYSHDDYDPLPRDADTETMLRECREWLPALSLSSTRASHSRVCFRTSTIDRLPYIGAVPDYPALVLQAAKYRSGTDLAKKITLEAIPGLFVNIGHGSRGLLSCPIGGEMIARLITGEPLRELKEVAALTTPSRVPWRLVKAKREPS
jgi:tRNA 5-methylaminomethyl-2-thiouridine biosynthesis bifunctional protein